MVDVPEKKGQKGSACGMHDMVCCTNDRWTRNPNVLEKQFCNVDLGDLRYVVLDVDLTPPNTKGKSASKIRDHAQDCMHIGSDHVGGDVNMSFNAPMLLGCK